MKHVPSIIALVLIVAACNLSNRFQTSNNSNSSTSPSSSSDNSVTVGDLRGLEFRQSKQERPDDIRRLEWQGYRTYAGQTQLVTIILSTNDTSFPKREDELYGILYSTKIVH